MKKEIQINPVLYGILVALPTTVGLFFLPIHWSISAPLGLLPVALSLWYVSLTSRMEQFAFDEQIKNKIFKKEEMGLFTVRFFLVTLFFIMSLSSVSFLYFYFFLLNDRFPGFLQVVALAGYFSCAIVIGLFSGKVSLRGKYKIISIPIYYNEVFKGSTYISHDWDLDVMIPIHASLAEESSLEILKNNRDSLFAKIVEKEKIKRIESEEKEKKKDGVILENYQNNKWTAFKKEYLFL